MLNSAWKTKMKHFFSKILYTFLCISILFSLASCHVDRYSATMLVRSGIGGTLSVRFGTLNGSLSESFRKDVDGEGALSYTASLGEGSLSVSYEGADGKMCPLFSLKGGESISDIGGYAEGKKGTRIRILIETDGKCKDGSVKIHFYNGEKS